MFIFSGNGPTCMPVCACVYHFVWLHFGKQAGAGVEANAAVARPFACLINIMTTAAHWPLRMAAPVISTLSPISSQHGARFRALSRGPSAVKLPHLNSWNLGVNILKCFSTWVYFTPVIRCFQCICYGCWTEDYCTYRNYFITISCCCFCEAVTFKS